MVMSLRVRLSMIISVLFLSGMVFGVLYQLSNARQRVTSEVESTARLTYQLLEWVLPLAEREGIEHDYALLVDQLLAVEDARHLDIQIEDANQEVLVSDDDGHEIRAPQWFVERVRPEPVVFVRAISDASDDIIVIRTNPADEIEEVWRESRNFILLLLLVLLAVNGILYVTIGRWLRPVNAIVDGLSDVEHGDLSGHIPQASLPELKVIAEKINQLTQVLRASKHENDRLAKRSLIIQEEERRHLAQELHDEMGQSISAIKAIAFSISERTASLDERSAQGAQRIGVISSHVSEHVRSMMRRLRPGALDELGLVAALQQMVDEWNEHHQDTFCSFRASGDFSSLDEVQQINVYRIVQEALTNIARHADAEEATVELQLVEDRVNMKIRDNGRGFVQDESSSGMGLSGIRERTQALHGQCQVISEPAKGTLLDIGFPLYSTAATKEAESE